MESRILGRQESREGQKEDRALFKKRKREVTLLLRARIQRDPLHRNALAFLCKHNRGRKKGKTSLFSWKLEKPSLGFFARDAIQSQVKKGRASLGKDRRGF